MTIDGLKIPERAKYYTKDLYDKLSPHIFDKDRGMKDTAVNKARESYIAEKVSNAVFDSCFCYDSGNIMAFNGKYYDMMIPDEEGALVTNVMKLCGINPLYCVSSVKSILTHIRRIIVHKPFSPTRHYISFNNCILNLDTKEQLEHKPDYHTELHVDFDYNPNADGTEFMKFVHEVMPDQATIDLLGECLGMAYIDNYIMKNEKVVCLIGEGANGKSVLLQAFQMCLGENNYTSYDPVELFEKEYNLADCNNKLGNVCTDVSSIDFSGAKFKRITSREPIQARHLYGKPFVARNIPPNYWALNKFPKNKDTSHGHWRRLIIIPFDRTFTGDSIDKNKLEKITSGEGLSAIFNFCMAGRDRLMKNSGIFTESKSSEAKLKELKARSNSVEEFITEMGYFTELPGTPKLNTQTKILYGEYVRYCDEQGIQSKYVRSQISFADALKEMGFATYRSGGYAKIDYYIRSEEEIQELENKNKDDDFAELPF